MENGVDSSARPVTPSTMATAAVNLAFGIGGYYFGSSAGSQKKDDVIASAATPKVGG